MQPKHPSGFNKFIHSIRMDMTKQPTKFHSFLTSALWENEDKIFKCLNIVEYGTQKIWHKNLHNYCFYKHLTSGNQLVCSLEMTVSTLSQLAARASQNFDINNYYIRLHLDEIFSYMGVLPPPQARLKIIFIYLLFLDK